MPNDIDPEVLQVIGCQGRQDRVVDFVLTKRPFVLPKAKAPEPVTYIDRAPTCHGLIVQAGTVVSRLAAMPLAIAVGRFTARSGLTQFSQENAPAASAESARAFGIKPHPVRLSLPLLMRHGIFEPWQTPMESSSMTSPSVGPLPRVCPSRSIAADLRRGSRRGCRVPGDTFFFGKQPSWRGAHPRSRWIA
jgi:hypothetical protein